MDLLPNADEEQVVDMAHGFLSKAYPAMRLHAADSGMYSLVMGKEFADLGWFGMGLSEADGGFGFSAVDEVLLFRELGRHLGPVAMLPICLAAKIAAANAKADIVAKLIAGEAIVALAIDDPNCQQSRLFEVAGAEYIVSLVGDEALLLDAVGLVVERIPCLDKSVTMGRADLSSARVIARTAATPITCLGRLLTAAMLVGASEAMTEMITEYAKIRETFGRPIGAYQAVRHPIAEMAVRTYAARCQLFLAAVSIRDNLPDAPLQTDAAKILANDVAIKNADANLQLHGGISTTDEHDSHFFMKRSHLLAEVFGNRSVLDRIITTAHAA